MAPFESNGHQVLKKRNAAHNQAARGELCIMPHRAEAHTTVLSKSVNGTEDLPQRD